MVQNMALQCALLLKAINHNQGVRKHVIKYSGTSIYRFSRDRRKQTMNAGKRSIRETITHYTLRGAFKF